MERKISVDYSFTFPFITDEQFNAYKDEALPIPDMNISVVFYVN